MNRDADGRIALAPWVGRWFLGLVAVYGLFVLLFPTRLWQPGRFLTPADHVYVLEAQRWLDGHLTLPHREFYDTALLDGRVYNHFPPLMTFICVALMQWTPQGVPFIALALLFVLPVPGLTYLLFSRRCDSVWAAVVMTCAFVLGTSEFCVLNRTMQSGRVWQLNNAISQVGLLLFLLGYLGRRRIWLCGIGLIVAILSRMTLAVYLVPFWWAVLRPPEDRRRKHWPIALAVTLVVTAIPLTLNTLKFGHPLNTGYRLIYEGRDDPLARSAREVGLFSPRYLPQNLYWMNLGFPTFERNERGQWRWNASTESVGIWWTTPVLLYLLLDARRIWRAAENRWLLSVAGVIYMVLVLYHNTGYSQRGYNRFSLDFMLPVLALIAPWAMTGRRRYVTPLLVAWGILYFCWINE